MSTLGFQHQLVGLRHQLYYFALSLTHDRDNAHDLLQESMLRALTYSDKFRDNTNLKAWVYTIMKNTFINGHRRNKRTDNVMEHVERIRERVSLVESPATPEAKVRMGEYASESEVIRDGLRALMARDRAVESWLHNQVAPAHDALRADPSRAVTADQVRARLAAERAKAG